MAVATESVQTPEHPPPTRLIGRRWDILIVVSALLLIAGAGHLNNMLFVGDWSFWADWKDRQWWPLLTPTLSIIVPAALQYITWTQLRLPFGATLGAVALILAEYASRYFSFEWWANIPLNFTWPETMVLAAVVLDVILLITRSFVLTSLFRGLMWGFVFWLFNWPALAPYMQPVEFHGYIVTVADVMSFNIVRTQTPEYLRIIEEGRLRALVENITIVVSFFAGMMSAAVYWFGLAIGKFLAVAPAGRFFRLGSD